MNDTRGTRSNGPWMLKAVGHWGTGKHALNKFEIFIDDLSRPPDDDDAPPGAPPGTPVARTFLEEDIEPEEGMDVQFDNQILRPRVGSAGCAVIEVSSAE